jgi:predicted  nucleic acid-binding Zn-ribbon protein
MKKLTLLIFMIWIIFPPMVLGQEIYQWVDEKGTVHFTDDISLVPEKFQDQVKKKKVPVEPTSPSMKVPEEPEPEPDTERKDLLGRGEDWWRDKATEWNHKLKNAKKNFEAAQAALKAKEKELEQSIYKPDSFKRRLQAEIKGLEENANSWKRQVDEAKNMLEKVLPKQAGEYRADPSWLKIE